MYVHISATDTFIHSNSHAQSYPRLALTRPQYLFKTSLCPIKILITHYQVLNLNTRNKRRNNVRSEMNYFFCA